MARGIGGGGGGHSSGSHSFGGGSFRSSSHSFGGSSFRSSSSSHRSTSSFGGGSYRGGSRGNYYGGPRNYHRSDYYRGPGYRGSGYRRSSSSGCGGCLSSIVILIIVFALAASMGSKSNSQRNSASSKQGLGRTKYTGAVDSSKGYYIDDSVPVDGEIYIDNSNKNYLIKGFSEFYNDTGVFPFLYVIDDYPAESEYTGYANYEEKLYDDLFNACPGNLLFVYIGNEQTFYTAAGNATGEIVDAESFEVIQADILSEWGENDLAKTFGYGLSAAGNRIMAESKAQKVMKSNNHKVIIALISAAGVIVVILVSKNWWEKKKQKEKEEDERLERILKQPLKTFGDSKMDDLTDKYDKTGSAVNNNYYSNNDDKGTL